MLKLAREWFICCQLIMPLTITKDHQGNKEDSPHISSGFISLFWYNFALPSNVMYTPRWQGRVETEYSRLLLSPHVHLAYLVIICYRNNNIVYVQWASLWQEHGKTHIPWDILNSVKYSTQPYQGLSQSLNYCYCFTHIDCWSIRSETS